VCAGTGASGEQEYRRGRAEKQAIVDRMNARREQRMAGIVLLSLSYIERKSNDEVFHEGGQRVNIYSVSII
jgi:hypothetical protein